MKIYKPRVFDNTLFATQECIANFKEKIWLQELLYAQVARYAFMHIFDDVSRRSTPFK